MLLYLQIYWSVLGYVYQYVIGFEITIIYIFIVYTNVLLFWVWSNTDMVIFGPVSFKRWSDQLLGVATNGVWINNNNN